MTQFFTKRVLPNPKTKKYSTDTTVYKAAQIWSMLPAKYKNLSSLDLKSEMKTDMVVNALAISVEIFVTADKITTSNN